MRNPIRDTAALFEAGLVPVPCCKPAREGGCSARWHAENGEPCGRVGKRPLIKGYPSLARATSTRGIIDHFARFKTANVSGVIRQGFVAIEGDSLDAQNELHDLLGGRWPRTPTRAARPGRGPAFIFKTDRPVVSGTKRGSSRAIDVLGAGRVLVLPPSRHASGHQVTWAEGRSPSETTPVPLPFALEHLLNGCRPRASGQWLAIARTTATELPARVGWLFDAKPRLRSLFNGSGGIAQVSRSEFDYALAAELLKARVPVDDIAVTLRLRPDSKRRSANYIAMTIEASLAAVRGAR